MSMIQVGMLGAAGALLAIQFKSGREEYGIYISIVLSLIIFFCVLDHMEMMVEVIKTISSYIHMETAYIGTLIKMLGITYIAEFSAGICKDAGYQTVAVQIEIFGKLSVLILSMPVFLTLLDTIQRFLS